MLIWVRRLLVSLNIANWVFGVIAVTGGIAVSWFLSDRFLAGAAALHVRSPEALIEWMRVVFPLTAPVILLAHIIFTRLIAIVDATRAGDPFSPANAVRLRVVAWALLGTQVIDLIFGVYSQNVSVRTGEYLGWSFGLTGWLAVLLLFVLARIFGQGAAMQAELAEIV